MTLNVDELLKLFPQLALVIVVLAVAGWAFLYRRRDERGDKRPPLLVGGWVVEEMEERHSAELSVTRTFYEKALLDCTNAANVRIEDIRAWRDQESARAKEAVALTKDSQDDIHRIGAAVDSQSQSLASLVELVRVMAARDGRQPEDSGSG